MLAAAGVLADAATPLPTHAAETPATEPAPPAAQVLARDVWLIPGSFPDRRQPDGNTVVFRGAHGLVVLDTGRHRWHRRAILDLAATAGRPIVAIVNSHWHLDHVSGNPDIRRAHPGVRVYASDAIDAALGGFLRHSAEQALAYLKTPGLPPETAEDIRGDLASIDDGAALRPDVVVAQSGTVELGGRQLDLRRADHGPTAGDLWIFDPATRIAAVGDLVTLPVPFLDTACVAGWRTALDQVGSTPFETLVPGHGKPMSRAEFGQYRAAFDAFVACARSTRGERECATVWTQAAGALLDANGMGRPRAEGMAAYYVKEVLRPHGGNSQSCAVRG